MQLYTTYHLKLIGCYDQVWCDIAFEIYYWFAIELVCLVKQYCLAKTQLLGWYRKDNKRLQ